MQTRDEVRDRSTDKATTENAFRAWPLIFTYQGHVFGRGFIATINAVSRVLGVQEDDGIWLSGVQPGGLAAGGKDLPAAYTDLRNTFLGILADIASTADTYEAFRAEVERFFDERDETAVADWNAAVAACRNNLLDRTPMSELPVLPAGMAPTVTVARRSEMTPADNLIDDSIGLAAAA